MKDLAEAARTLTRLRLWDCFDPADLATYDSFYKASVEESAAPAEDVAPETSVGARPFAPPSDFEGRRQALYCFLDSAFGGGSDTDDRNFMIRWETDINVSVEGEYTQEDLSFLDSFLARLGREVPGLPPVTRRGDKAEAGINVAFAPLSRMGNYVRDYEEGSWGYYYFSYEDSRLTRVDIAIASDVTSQAQRNYLILYEMAGALGLIDPIHSYSDSILYDDWTEAQELSPLDFMILGYLYNSALDAGMTAPEAYAALYPGLSQ